MAQERAPAIRPFDFDDHLLALTREQGRTCSRVYPWRGRAVVLGRGSKAEVELDLEACRREGVEIFRRRGGGCSVYLDEGTAIATLTFPLPGLGRIEEAWRRSLDWLQGGLARLGYKDLGRQGISDLTLGDRKVAGTCLYRTAGAVLFSASLLVTTRLEEIGRYLPAPPREPAYRRGRDHGDFLTCLGGPAEDLDAFCRRLGRELDGEPS